MFAHFICVFVKYYYHKKDLVSTAYSKFVKLIQVWGPLFSGLLLKSMTWNKFSNFVTCPVRLSFLVYKSESYFGRIPRVSQL